MKEIFTAIAFAVLLTAVPAIAADTSTDNQPASSTSSGPGVKGAPGNKNGPAAQPNSMDKAAHHQELRILNHLRMQRASKEPGQQERPG